jgi:hypothetical protein
MAAAAGSTETKKEKEKERRKREEPNNEIFLVYNFEFKRIFKSQYSVLILTFLP